MNRTVLVLTEANTNLGGEYFSESPENPDTKEWIVGDTAAWKKLRIYIGVSDQEEFDSFFVNLTILHSTDGDSYFCNADPTEFALQFRAASRSFEYTVGSYLMIRIEVFNYYDPAKAFLVVQAELTN